MAIKPILFSTPMIQAILDGRKTQTRRIIDVDSTLEYRGVVTVDEKRNGNHIFIIGPNKWTEQKPKYQPGDILWVRETWARVPETAYGTNFIFKASFDRTYGGKWKPSIHMPKEAARIFLKVADVRVERLQDISKDDAIKEGIVPLAMSKMQLATMGQMYFDYSKPKKLFVDGLPPFWSFNSLWCSINGGDSWDINPFVWVYTFEVVEKPENFIMDLNLE